MTPGLPDITISLTRYAETDALLENTLVAIALQRGVRGRVLFFDQRPHDAFTRRIEDLPRRLASPLAFEVVPIPANGLSFARNEAIRRATTDILLYVDADAVPDQDWARLLTETIQDPKVAIAGCRILPAWPTHESPIWLARSRLVQEQYSLLDLGTGRKPARKVVGAGFGIDRRKLADQAYFDEALGRRNGNLAGGEETDLCARARGAGWEIAYDGRALVHHQIPAARNRFAWLAKRFFAQGRDRAVRSGAPQPSHQLSSGDLLRAGLLLTFYAAGYARGLIARRRSGS